MDVALFIGIAAAISFFALMLMRRRVSASANPSASADSGDGPSYSVKARFKSALKWFMREDHPSGVKVTLELFDGAPLVRLTFHNQTQDQHTLPFDRINEVRHLLNPVNLQGVVIDIEEPIQVGDGQTDEIVLMFVSGGEGNLFDKLRDWLDPNTRFVFDFGEGERVNQGRGGAMRA